MGTGCVPVKQVAALTCLRLLVSFREPKNQGRNYAKLNCK